MGRRNYPIQGPPEYTSRQCRPGITECDGCQKKFDPVERFAIIETQVSWFRGDDMVKAFCEGCCKVKGMPPPPPARAHKHQCPLCGRNFRGEQGMADHTRAKHPESIRAAHL